MREKVPETILALALALIAIYWVTKKTWFLLAAVVLVLIALLIPALANAIYKGWTKITTTMGFVINKVVLTIVFIVFLIPLSFLSRLFRGNSLKRKPVGDSYFKNRNYTFKKESVENIW